MRDYKINVNYIKKKIEQANRLKGLAIGNAERRFNIAQEKLLEDFDDHIVTKEIEAGPQANSQVLNEGNLFSFIGFNAGDNPTKQLRNLLFSQVRFIRNPSVIKGKNKIVFEFPVAVPSEQSIEKETQMPEWSEGSWARKVERGISGLEYYLFGRFFSGSRSTTAIQIKNKIRSNIFKGIPYLTELFNNFRKRL